MRSTLRWGPRRRGHWSLRLIAGIVLAALVTACGGGGGGSGGTSPPPPPPPTAASMTKVLGGDGQTAQVGTAVAIPPAVLLTNSSGQPVSGVAVTFSLTSGEGGSITGAAATSNAQGIATVGSWVLAKQAGNTLLVARTAGVTGVTFEATGVAGPAATVSVNAGNNQSGSPGMPLYANPTVLVADSFGNPVSGVTVSFTVTAGGGSVTRASDASDSNGLATVGSWTLGPAAGTNTLNATAGALAPATFTATGVIGSGFTAVMAGDAITCALKGTAAYCWGDNTVGEIGDGTFTQRLIPTAVIGGLAFSQISESGTGPGGSDQTSHTCALATSGQVYCWGSNSQRATSCPGNCNEGYLGVGLAKSQLALTATPMAVAGNRTYTSVSTGQTSGCAIGSDGNPYCWGNCITGCGATTSQQVLSPTEVSSTPSFSTITTASGSFDVESDPGPRLVPEVGYSCALTAGGAAYCWGTDTVGVIGNGTTPTAVLTGLTVVSISLSAVPDHGCALVTGGAAYCWGQSYDGQLGIGMSPPVPVTAPALVSGGLTFTQIASGWGVGVPGYGATCALTSAGAAYCWGADYGYVPTAVPMPAGVTFTEISIGNDHACALTSTGAIYCWGQNYAGQLGTGNTVSSTVPVPVTS
jgi:alpha-tubulin suppressor-like RCC1 family protein